ncbi:MAG: hypothetical protein ACI8ZB_001395 [Desulforhopalus sp.]|jgi:hypothetical protein
MAVSSISNTNVTANQANYQKTATSTEQSEKRQAGHSSDNGTAGNKSSDNVTLNQSVVISKSEEIATSVNALDKTSAENLLKQIMSTIATEGQTAISTQANLSPQVAQTLLAD